jgi:hypothetical protein
MLEAWQRAHFLFGKPYPEQEQTGDSAVASEGTQEAISIR